jgi:hypothetical protein
LNGNDGGGSTSKPDSRKSVSSPYRFSRSIPSTRDFKVLNREQAQIDPAFGRALLREAIECMLNGDVATGKAVLRDYINATVGFPGLEKTVKIPAASLMRMFGPKGNPTAANIFGVLAELQKYEGSTSKSTPARRDDQSLNAGTV